jgi:hypothetical protein
MPFQSTIRLILILSAIILTLVLSPLLVNTSLGGRRLWRQLRHVSDKVVF